MPEKVVQQITMEVLSPRSANIPARPRTVMKKPKQETKPKPEEKPSNPDRIDDKWRPPTTVTEPGPNSETYTTGKKLGKGGFAVCFEGKTEKRGEIFALKIVKAQVQQKKMMEKFRTEMQIHAKMRHPNIVEFHRAFSLGGHTYVVLEMCENGSLTDMVKARSCLSLPEVRRFMIQICGGVKYLHKRSVIHRDLKMGNIFLDSKLNLKIGDFGLAAVMADEQDRRTTLCGTPNYIAPEILSKSGTRGHDFKVDTWAIGVICYAMLMGTPPFQSKTQQEIYTKLKTLEYEWKLDSINYIPQEAKDCVASCLNLTAAERPDMDELVNQDFFKNGVIADTLEYSCLQSKPSWLQNADPRGDRVRTGYGIDYDRMCSECGVGKLQNGIPRPTVGEKTKLSALVEIEIENRQGTAPVTPLPEGILYKQFAEVKVESISAAAFIPRSRKPVGDVGLLTVKEDNTVAAPSTAAQAQRIAPLSKPTQSFAAQQRQQALPRTVVPRTTIAITENDDIVSATAAEKPVESQGLLRARPVRSASTRTTRSAQHQDVNHTKPTPALTALDDLKNRLLRETELSIQQDIQKAVLRAAPRSTRSRLDLAPRPVSVCSTRSSEPDTNGAQSDVQSIRKQIGRPRSVAITSVIDMSHTSKEPTLSQPRFRFKPRLIDDSENWISLSSTSQERVTKGLRDLHVALGLPSTQSITSDARPVSVSSKPHPRVDKWVDYATKHGIAYILSEGTLGMILKSCQKDAAASSCIVVRHARRHTVKRARGLEHQFVPQGSGVPDVEFYEQVDPESDMRRFDVKSQEFELDLVNHSSQVSAATAVLNTLSGSAAQRMKEVGLLDKFGKYMNKQMGSSGYTDADAQHSVNSQFIHFYQRMGNVGSWRFSDGGLQFNFPDHTKLVVYQPETTVRNEDALIDVVYLEPADAKALSSHGHLSNEALERRGLRTFRLRDIRDNNLRRSEMDIVKYNEINEKLSWIRGVIGCWIKGGGLGWTGDEKLGWSGMQEKRDDKRIKLQWVTVGRPGGDDEVVTK